MVVISCHLMMCVSLLQRLAETPWHYCHDRKSRINHHPPLGFTLCTRLSHVWCPIQPSDEIVSRLGTAVIHALDWQMCVPVSPSQLLLHGIWWPFGNPSFLTESVYFYSLLFSFSICAISAAITSLGSRVRSDPGPSNGSHYNQHINQLSCWLCGQQEASNLPYSLHKALQTCRERTCTLQILAAWLLMELVAEHISSLIWALYQTEPLTGTDQWTVQTKKIPALWFNAAKEAIKDRITQVEPS